ncbi:hypothetical protein SCA6_001172 [Theobroma cacao]
MMNDELSDCDGNMHKNYGGIATHDYMYGWGFIWQSYFTGEPLEHVERLLKMDVDGFVSLSKLPTTS